MSNEEFETHRWYKNEKVMCSGVEMQVHSVNFESGMVGIHNDIHTHEVNFSNIQIL